MAQTDVDPAILRSEGAKLDGAVGTVKGILTQLQGIVHDSQGHFTGGAAVAFRASAEHLNQAVAAVNNTNASIAQAIHTSAGKFDAQEQQAQHTFTTLRNL